MTRRLWDWLDTEHARNVVLIALAAPFVSLSLSFFLVSPSYFARVL